MKIFLKIFFIFLLISKFISCSTNDDTDKSRFEKLGSRADYALDFDGSNDYVNIDFYFLYHSLKRVYWNR